MIADDGADDGDARRRSSGGPRRVVDAVPTQPSSAGSSVSEPTIISSTPIAEAMATPLDELQAHEEQAEQRDDHGDAGEQHGPARGVDRLDDGVLDVEPEVQALPVAGDDEQRVVDADAEADHRHHLRREVGHRDDVAGRAPRAPMPMPRPNRAVPIGRPIASTEPKATSRMMTAARMPRISLSGSSNSPNSSPPYSICQALGDRWLVAEVLDRRSPSSVTPRSRGRHVELGEGDRAVLADLLRVVVGAGDRDAVLLGGEVHDRRQRRLHRRVVDALVGLDDDLRREAGPVGLFASSRSCTSFDSLSGSTKSVR